MKLKHILYFCNTLNEDNKDITKLTTGGAQGKNGKGADSIATGAATPYKNTQSKNIFDKKFPAISNVIKRMKKDGLKGDQVVSGAALAQVKNMLGVLPINKDENGDYILPFGNNIRLKERKGLFYIGMKQEKKVEGATDLTAVQAMADDTQI